MGGSCSNPLSPSYAANTMGRNRVLSYILNYSPYISHNRNRIVFIPCKERPDYYPKRRCSSYGVHSSSHPYRYGLGKPLFSTYNKLPSWFRSQEMWHRQKKSIRQGSVQPHFIGTLRSHSLGLLDQQERNAKVYKKKQLAHHLFPNSFASLNSLNQQAPTVQSGLLVISHHHWGF